MRFIGYVTCPRLHVYLVIAEPGFITRLFDSKAHESVLPPLKILSLTASSSDPSSTYILNYAVPYVFILSYLQLSELCLDSPTEL